MFTITFFLTLYGIFSLQANANVNGNKTSLLAKTYASSVLIECLLLRGRYDAPWDSPTSQLYTSTGFYIGNKEIIAFVTTRSKFAISWRICNSVTSNMHVATVLYRSPNSKYVILTVENDSFWNEMEPLTITETLPRLQEEVISVGYNGVDKYPKARSGIIYQFDARPIYFDGYQNALVKSDMACSDSILGAPVISKDRNQLIGIVGWCNEDSSNVEALILPVAFLYYFLKTRDSAFPYQSYVILNKSVDLIISPTMRTYYGLDRLEKENTNNSIDVRGSGVIIRDGESEIAKAYVKLFGLKPSSWKNYALQSGDILLSLNGYKIYSDLTIRLFDNRAVGWIWVLWNVYKPGLINAVILRNGILTEKKIGYAPVNYLVSSYTDFPHYVIFGGNVFQPLNFQLDRYILSPDVQGMKYNCIPQHFPDEEIVLWTNAVSCELGYEPPPTSAVVVAVNGIAISNLQTFREQLKVSSENEKYTVIMLSNITSNGLTYCSPKGPLHINLRKPTKDGKLKTIQDPSCRLLIFDSQAANDLDKSLISSKTTSSLSYGIKEPTD